MTAAAEDDDPPGAGVKPSPAGGNRAIAVTGGRIDSRDIFIGTREIMITHGRELYRLRLTAQNKLILTK